jgi:hypothetical protein
LAAPAVERDDLAARVERLAGELETLHAEVAALRARLERGGL